MLGSIRKFSSSIYAKILLGIIIIPFVFWGMGSSIRGGSKNIVVIIDGEKYSTQEFSDFIRSNTNKKVEPSEIEGFLSSFIGEKIIEKEIEFFEIKLSDNSLSKLIKHQKNFKRENKFSRTEYEKFLLKNNITATTFESILAKEEKKKQLLDLIGGGVSPSKFLVNIAYDRVNQKRYIELLNLNDVFKKQLNFSKSQIRTHFENNKNKYTEIYKSIKLLELNPKKLVDDNEFTDLFFKKIDEIDDLIISGVKINDIVQKFDLEKPNYYTINEFGKNIKSEKNKKISDNLLKKIFSENESVSTFLLEDKNKFFVIEIIKAENIQKNIEDEIIKKEVEFDLGKKTKRKLTAEIIAKINKSNFNKLDFDKLSKDENVEIQKITLTNLNDDKILDKRIVNQIFAYPEKKVIVVNDIAFTEIYLIYTNKIENTTIGANSDEYQKYLDLSKTKIANDLYNTYDDYIRGRYKIDINYQTLDVVKNYYN